MTVIVSLNWNTFKLIILVLLISFLQVLLLEKDEQSSLKCLIFQEIFANLRARKIKKRGGSSVSK